MLVTRDALLRWPRCHPRRRIFCSWWLRAASSVAPKTPPEAIAEPKIPNVGKRRSSKFTPERLEQIRNLIALGKSKEEIAELVGALLNRLMNSCRARCTMRLQHRG